MAALPFLKQLLFGSPGPLLRPCRGKGFGHLASSGVIWPHLASSGVIWRQLASSGLIWPHLASSDLIWTHLASSGLIWPHLASSGLIWASASAYFKSYRMTTALVILMTWEGGWEWARQTCGVRAVYLTPTPTPTPTPISDSY